jgi:hypothetical protein
VSEAGNPTPHPPIHGNLPTLPCALLQVSSLALGTQQSACLQRGHTLLIVVWGFGQLGELRLSYARLTVMGHQACGLLSLPWTGCSYAIRSYGQASGAATTTAASFAAGVPSVLLPVSDESNHSALVVGSTQGITKGLPVAACVWVWVLWRSGCMLNLAGGKTVAF